MVRVIHGGARLMKQSVIGLAAAALVIVFSATLSAHHSAIQFDFTKTVTISGVVMKFRAINPHMQLVLRVKDDKGERDIVF
jgi:hypothetical protein